MLAARQDGLAPDEKCFSLNQLISGQVARPGGKVVAMYKSVGSGLQDVVVAGMILDLARSAGTAVPLSAHFEPKCIG